MKNLHEKIKYAFIDNTSELYDEAIELRYREFYLTSNRTKESIFDEFENDSYRIVAYIHDKVIGHARLHIEGTNGEITQVVVDHEYRGMKIGNEILKRIIERAKEENISILRLDSRATAVEFYKKFGFTAISEEFISKKSGMPIVRMEKHI